MQGRELDAVEDEGCEAGCECCCYGGSVEGAGRGERVVLGGGVGSVFEDFGAREEEVDAGWVLVCA